MKSDPQQERVYAWERAFVETKVPDEVMSRDETLLLVARAAGLLLIPSPKVRFLALNVSCRADMRRNSLEIADWGRTRPTLLHEMAHLGTVPDVLAGDSPHGRAFVATAMGLYARFLRLPLDYLVETALIQRLDFDEHRARGPLHAEAVTSFYPGEI